MTARRPASLFGRATAVLVGGLVLTHLISLAIHYGDESHRAALTGEDALVTRIASAARALASIPAEQRAAMARELSDPGVAVGWPGPDRPAAEAAAGDAHAARVRDRLAAALPAGFAVGRAAILACSPTELCGEAGERLEAVVGLPDGSTLSIVTGLGGFGAVTMRRIALEILIMAAGIVALSLWAAGWLTRPLSTFALAADRLGRDLRAPPIAQAGPREIRQLARAFNGMQSRLRRFLDDRTQMLAAVSHDLRTPITRLRLRAEFIDDQDAHARMLADLDEMERMIDSALAFARDEAGGETRRRVDLTALVESICHDAEDAGQRVSCTGSAPAPVEGNRLALKRAIANLIDNAVKHGGAADVALGGDDGEARITVDDRGPGLPDRELEEVFRPFYRAAGRGGDAAGSGLGLAIARSILRGHGGEVRLENRPGGGLRATASLPCPRS